MIIVFSESVSYNRFNIFVIVNPIIEKNASALGDRR